MKSNVHRAMATESVRASAVSGFSWAAFRLGARALLQLGVLSLLARKLSPADFGVVSAAMVIVGFSQIFGDLGVGPAIVQRAYLKPRHVWAGWFCSVLLGAVIAIILYVSSPLISAFFGMPKLAGAVRALSFLFPLSGFAVVPRALLMRRLQFKKLAASELIAFAVGYCSVAVILALAGLGYLSLIVASLCEGAVMAAMLIWLAKQRLKFIFNWRSCLDLMNFGAGYTLAKIGNFLALQGDYIVAGRWLGASQLGIYSRSYQLVSVPTTILGSAVDQVLFPLISRFQADRFRVSSIYLRAIAIIAMVAFPAMGVLLVLAPEIIHLLLGQNWSAAIVPFQILAATLLFRTSYKISDSIAQAVGAVYHRAWRQWVYAAVVFSGAFIGHYWGVRGVAVGVSIGITANFLFMTSLSVKLLSLSWAHFIKVHARHLLVGLSLSVSGYLVASFLRAYSAPDLAVVAAVVTCIAGGWSVLWLIRPSLFGDEGVWLRSLVLGVVGPYRVSLSLR